MRLGDRTAACGDHGWAQPFPPQHGGIVEIDEVGRIVELEFGERERKPPALQKPGDQSLSAEPRKLFDERRQRTIGEIKAPVEILIVVPSFALKRAGKPERSIGFIIVRAFVPREAAVENHA